MTTKPRTSSLLIALVLLISGLVAAPPASADPVVEAPVVAADGAYEISTAGQLLFLSHNYGTVGFFNHLGDSESQGTIRDTGFDNIQVTGANTVGAIAGGGAPVDGADGDAIGFNRWGNRRGG